MTTLRSSSLLLLNVIVLLLLLLLLNPSPADAYASWLKCYVDLDPSEVIMFNKVIPSDRARHAIGIEVKPISSDNNNSNNNNNDDDSKWLSSKDVDDNGILWLPTPSSSTSSSNDGKHMLLVRLSVPSHLDVILSELQYVIEVKTSIADAAAEAVEFVKTRLMCDGKRGFSTEYNEPLWLQIDTQLHPTLGPIQLTAGWAFGVEAVTLTSTLTIQTTTRRSGTNTATMPAPVQEGATIPTLVPPPSSDDEL